jgi:hypothetical protein
MMPNHPNISLHTSQILWPAAAFPETKSKPTSKYHLAPESRISLVVD